MRKKITKYKVEDLPCPQCVKVHKFKSYSLIKVTEKPELKEDVLQNRLFVFRCDACGLTAPLTYESVYVDTKKQLLIYLAPEMTPNTQVAISAWEPVNFKYKRLVNNINDLKEKILIADNLLDDRIIEFMKIENLQQLKKEMENDNLMNILFDYKGDQYYFLVFFERKGMGRIPVGSDYYRGAVARHAAKLSNKQSKGFQVIDMEWAGNILLERN